MVTVGEGWIDGARAAEHAAAVRRTVLPSALDARLLRVTFEMEDARARGDRETHRVLAEEQVVLTALIHPRSMRLPDEPSARATAVAGHAKVVSVMSFDADLRAKIAAYGEATGKLSAIGDPVERARAMLDAARTYYRALAVHPDLPVGFLREGVEHHAREMVRSAVEGWSMLLGAGAVERIRIEVLGDIEVARDQARCPKCGAPLASTGIVSCPHCGAVTRVDVVDAWTQAQLALWELSLAELMRRPEGLDGPSPVIAAVGGFAHTAAREVEPALAARFLRRAIPWVSADDLAAGFAILRHATDPAWLDAIRAELGEWTADPAQRPVRGAPKEIAPPTFEQEQAWVEQALAIWSRAGGTTPLELLGPALSALQVAAVHEVSCGVTARSALDFFERAQPGFDRTAMLAQVDLLYVGYDQPRVRAFFDALRARLRA